MQNYILAKNNYYIKKFDLNYEFVDFLIELSASYQEDIMYAAVAYTSRKWFYIKKLMGWIS